uniref:Cytoplasmic dynein 2 heavy chain 1 n=1 Tax=Lygus hesperus TaxID=30085 RepID=A0A0A9YLP5_LYGHE
MRTSTPETEYPPFLSNLTSCQRLLVMKVLRPDRLSAAMNLIACTALHVDSLGENNTLSSLIDNTVAAVPVLLITTPGSDPSQELQSIAHGLVGKDRFHQLAMGGGQATEALGMIKRAAEFGDWVFLKNLHLVIDWVSVMQKELNMLTLHKDFRLFMTT